MLAIAVCDDQLIMQQEIIQKVKAYFEKSNLIVSIQSFASGEELLDCKAHFDIVFLDMKMKELTGLDTAVAIRASNNNCAIIFVTFYQDYVFDAFDVNASHYLLKPISDEKLSRALDKVMSNPEQPGEPPCLLVKRGYGYTKILYSDIMYFESDGHKINVHTANGGKEDYYEKLDVLEGQLDERFCRCHRAFIVNIEFVFKKKDNHTILTNGEVLPVSKRKQQSFSEKLLKYLKKEVL